MYRLSALTEVCLRSVVRFTTPLRCQAFLYIRSTAWNTQQISGLTAAQHCSAAAQRGSAVGLQLRSAVGLQQQSTLYSRFRIRLSNEVLVLATQSLLKVLRSRLP